jgi:hypothetical protein
LDQQERCSFLRWTLLSPKNGWEECLLFLVSNSERSGLCSAAGFQRGILPCVDRLQEIQAHVPHASKYSLKIKTLFPPRTPKKVALPMLSRCITWTSGMCPLLMHAYSMIVWSYGRRMLPMLKKQKECLFPLHTIDHMKQYYHYAP